VSDATRYSLVGDLQPLQPDDADDVDDADARLSEAWFVDRWFERRGERGEESRHGRYLSLVWTLCRRDREK
jgi:hypothetical protein